MSRDAFWIDLARCTGCQACRIACKDRAGLPDALDWLRVEAQEGGAYPHPTLTYRVVHCFHCAAPACAAACPTAAIATRPGGWVQIDAALCIACGACVEACPFGAIVLDGAAIKCDGCGDERERGWDPTCVRACPMRALSIAPADALLPERRIPDPTFDDQGIGPAVVYLRRAPGET
ncbi:MAG: 4Fe-4S dicluster domain-containing protein [Anaerolineae bacterium]|nr:4Fe-4S dicluster domain-containing protein [Anaerolineae bacterium]